MDSVFGFPHEVEHCTGDSHAKANADDDQQRV